MKLVSIENTNTNTNTLNITLSAPITIKELMEKEEVQNFSHGVNSDFVETLDGNDLSCIPDKDNLQINDDTVLEISSYGEFVRTVVSTPQQGRVEVTSGGAAIRKGVTIISGITTVRQALTERVANAFGKSREELQQMKIHVNDDAATLETVLKDGDEIVLEERKAGEDGADYIKVEDHVGCIREYSTDEYDDLTVSEFVDTIAGDFIEEYIDILALNGQDLGDINEGLAAALLETEVYNFESIKVNGEFALPEDDEDFEDEEDELAEGVACQQNIPAVGAATVGSVTVSQGGTSQVKMMVTSGQTTVKDVVMSNKILNTFAMTTQQMGKMVFNVNDVRSTLDQVLRAGDSLVIEAPKCGEDGTHC